MLAKYLSFFGECGTIALCTQKERGSKKKMWTNFILRPLPATVAAATLVATYAAGWSHAPSFSLSHVGSAPLARVFLSGGVALYVYLWWSLATRPMYRAETVLAYLAGSALFVTALFADDDFPTLHDVLGGIGTFSSFFWVAALAGRPRCSVLRVLVTIGATFVLTALAALYLRGNGGADSRDIAFGILEAVVWLFHAILVGSAMGVN